MIMVTTRRHLGSTDHNMLLVVALNNCGHFTCAKRDCTFGKRNYHHHILTGSFLSSWQAIMSHTSGAALRIVRVTCEDGKRIVSCDSTANTNVECPRLEFVCRIQPVLML